MMIFRPTGPRNESHTGQRDITHQYAEIRSGEPGGRVAHTSAVPEADVDPRVGRGWHRIPVPTYAI
jgi:hypothetical protein